MFVAADILDKCHSFFYFPFLLIGDILHFFITKVVNFGFAATAC